MLPNFLIVGAPKAATTALYHYLCQHPDIFMSTPKEVNFFSREEIERQGLFYQDVKIASLNDYEQLFAKASSATAIGEASVSYLFYPETPAKIAAAIPDVKIIILLRNPLERGLSHYLMDYRLGLCNVPYSDIVFKTNKDAKSSLYYQQYIELGLYAQQLERYFSLFPKENIRILLQEDLQNNPADSIKSIYNFLHVSTEFTPDLDTKHNSFTMPKNSLIHWLYTNHVIRRTLSFICPDSVKFLMAKLFFETSNKPAMNDEIKAHLASIYNPDIDAVEQLIGRDLSKWRIK